MSNNNDAPLELNKSQIRYDPSTKHANKNSTLQHPPVFEPLDNTQVEKLLARVGLNQKFLHLAINDEELIKEMRETILYQNAVI